MSGYPPIEMLLRCIENAKSLALKVNVQNRSLESFKKDKNKLGVTNNAWLYVGISSL